MNCPHVAAPVALTACGASGRARVDAATLDGYWRGRDLLPLGVAERCVFVVA